MIELPSLKELEVFRTMLTTGSATAAAERLGVSQPTVSRTLAQTEERMGMILFVRQNGRLMPTAEAIALNTQLDTLFDGIDQVRRFADEAEAVRGGRLRVLAPPSFCSHFVTPMIVEFKRANPTVLIELRVVSSQEAVNKITALEGDLAVTTNRVTHQGVRMETMSRTQSVCVMPLGHRLASKPVVHARDLEGEPFIALASNLKARRGVDRIFERGGVNRNIVIETTTNHAACECAAAGLGITVVNPFPVIMNFKGQVAVRPFLPKFDHSVYAMFPVDSAPNWAARAFLAYLKRSAAAWKLDAQA
ncbi:MAG: LysR family transcriptional regulator [Rhodospirillales bacterium]|nr:LysR family transcriptional regulator [Rhodospirillales bacterium]MBO6788591.1 LysR family transcriptional regulator [Rhodospirillales bacterium]